MNLVPLCSSEKGAACHTPSNGIMRQSAYISSA